MGKPKTIQILVLPDLPPKAATFIWLFYRLGQGLFFEDFLVSLLIILSENKIETFSWCNKNIFILLYFITPFF